MSGSRMSLSARVSQAGAWGQGRGADVVLLFLGRRRAVESGAAARRARRRFETLEAGVWRGGCLLRRTRLQIGRFSPYCGHSLAPHA